MIFFLCFNNISIKMELFALFKLEKKCLAPLTAIVAEIYYMWVRDKAALQDVLNEEYSKETIIPIIH